MHGPISTNTLPAGEAIFGPWWSKAGPFKLMMDVSHELQRKGEDYQTMGSDPYNIHVHSSQQPLLSRPRPAVV